MTVRTKVEIRQDAVSDVPNNTSNEVSPADVRNIMLDMLDSMPFLTDVLNPAAIKTLIEREALSAPRLVLQTNTMAMPWNGGSAATLQGLTRPYEGQWLDNTRASLYAYGPLAGCSLVQGGIHFDWTDTGVASVDMMFEVTGGGEYGVARIGPNGLLLSVWNLDSANSDPWGIAIDGGKAYVVDDTADKVFVYRVSDGARQSSEEWNLDSANGNPRGIAIDGGKAYVVNDTADKVFVYRVSDGARQSSEEWNLDSANGTPRGIAIDGGKAYVVNYTADKVFVYRVSDGARQSSEEWNLDSANGNPRGIAIDGGKAYVVNDTADKVFVYRVSDGARQSSEEWNLDSANGNPRGIAIDGGKAYVVNDTADKVFVYRVSDGARFGLAKTGGGLIANEMDSFALNEIAVSVLRSGVATVTRNDYLLMAGLDLSPFRLAGTVLNVVTT